MHPRNFVVFDVEKEYARNLVEAFSARKELGFQLYLFRDLERLKEFSKEKRIQILLMCEEIPPEDRKTIQAEERFVLVKGDEYSLESDEKEIYKYQSSDMILSKILEKQYHHSGEERNYQIDGQLIGIYSPVHRIGKTRFALELGKKIAQEKSVLYLNLEEYSGMEYYFPEKNENNLGDLIYFVRQDKEGIGMRISSMTNQMEGVDYIAPMPVIQDLHEIGEEEWMDLFQEIFSHCIYRTIILDLGDAVRGLYQILRQCHTVYTLHGADQLSRAKIKQYTENLRILGFTDVLEHTILKEISAGEVNRNGHA